MALNNKFCWFRIARAKPFKGKTRENPVKTERSIKIKKAKKIGKTLEKPKQNQLETFKQNTATIHKVLDNLKTTTIAILTKADIKINAHIHKQNWTQTSYWDKQKQFMLTYISSEKKKQDKLLRQMHTYNCMLTEADNKCSHT